MQHVPLVIRYTFVIGGWNGANYLSSVEVFDTIIEEWSSIPNMISGRDGCASVSLGKKNYAFRGSIGISDILSSSEVYDIATEEWTQLLEMKEKRVDFAATTVGNTI